MPRHKKRFEVEILGTRYPIVSARDAAHVEKVAKLVDDFVSQVLKNRRGSSSMEAAVLAALNFADAYLDEKQSSEDLKRELHTKISGMIGNLDTYMESRGES